MSAHKKPTGKNLVSVVAGAFGTVLILLGLAYATVNGPDRYLDRARAENAVVVLEDGEAGSGSGATGTIIGHNLILTARHVVKDSVEQRIKVVATDYRGNHYDTTVVWQSETQDLAVLYAVLPEGSASEPITCALPQVGDTFVMLGHPQLAAMWTFAWGKFTSDRRFEKAENLGKLLVGESAGTNGDSGAPIFNARNEIMGVLTGGIPGSGTVFITPLGDDCNLIKRVTN